MIGRVQEISAVGVPVYSALIEGVRVQCVRIFIAVENVLKGSSGDDLRGFYFLEFSAHNIRDLGPPIYVPTRGQRRMFFLAYDSGVLRTIGDIRDYTLRVIGGPHNRESFQGLPSGQRIATALLTPENEYRPADLATGLDEAANASDSFASRAFTDGMLRRLASMTDEVVSKSARELLRARELP